MEKLQEAIELVQHELRLSGGGTMHISDIGVTLDDANGGVLVEEDDEADVVAQAVFNMR